MNSRKPNDAKMDYSHISVCICDLSNAHILLFKLFLYIPELSPLMASVILELGRGNEMFERKMYNYRFVVA